MICPLWNLQVFSDRDLATEAGKARVEAALARADILFASLLFDYDQVGGVGFSDACVVPPLTAS